MCFKFSFWKRYFRLLVAVALAVCFTPSVALAVDITNANSPYSTTADNTDQHKLKTHNNISLTNDFVINYNNHSAVRANSITGVTITNNGTITNRDVSGKNYAIQAQGGSVTITNSGTIEAAQNYAIDIIRSVGSVITNNAGGIIKSLRYTINGSDAATSNTTITNSGSIYLTEREEVIQFSNATGTTITNNAGGEIYRDIGAIGSHPTIQIGPSSSITNSGQIRDDSSIDWALSLEGNNTTVTNNSGGLFGGEIRITASATSAALINSGTIAAQSPSDRAIFVQGDNATVTLKDKGIVVGTIEATGTGTKLQLQQGFGRTYFYETSGDFDLEDLSGNTVVKGSAGSVSLGRQETVDELLGLRTYNLRSALKRYASAPKPSDKNMVWGETFGYSSKRGGTDTLLKYDTYGYGMNFIHPVMSKLDLILSVERNELDFPEEYDVSRTGFLAGVNVSEFSGFGKGNWKLGGFAVAGMGWYDSTREILTNTTSSGLLDVTAAYKSLEVMTGFNFNHSYQSPSKGWMKNKWDTEMGLTLQGSHTGDYNERHYFFFEEHTLVQESIHLGEQLTSTFNDRLGITLGLEYEFRSPIAGKKQTYRINGTPTDYTDGSFTEHSGSGNLGLNYRFGWFGPSESRLNQGLAYIQLSSRLSDENRGTYGGSFGIRLNF